MHMHWFSKEELQGLVERRDGVCVSIFLPTEKAGKEIQQNGIRFKNLLRRAEEEIQKGKLLRSLQSREFLKPVHDLIEDGDFWQHQRDGLAVFRSHALFRHYRVPIRFPEIAVVGDHFYLKPMLRLLTGDGRFYVLGLDRKQARLYEATRFTIDEVDLGDTPTNYLDVVGRDLEAAYLQFHAGASTGRGERSVQFHGGGGSEDDVKMEIRKFFAALDRGVRRVLRGHEAPLVLAGVEYLAPIYREASAYPHLLDEEVPIHPTERRPEELHAKAWAVVEPLFLRERKTAAGRFRYLLGTGRASEDLREVVPAAAEGRVDVLFVAQGERRWGTFRPDDRVLAQEAGPRPENVDLLDFAAVKTLLHGGRVYAVEREQMPAEGAPIAAVFRY